MREHTRWNEEMVRRYDIDAYYERSHPLVRWVEARRIQTLTRLAGAGPSTSVLEVGCGAGHVLRHFEGERVCGIDLSDEMLSRARRRLGSGRPLARAAAETLPFRDASWDVVICTEVLEHTRDPAAVLAELVRLVRSNGRLVVSIPNEKNIDRAKRALRRVPGLRSVLRTLAGEGNEWHLHDFDLALLRRIAQPVAALDRVVGVPLPGMAVRYVALLRPLEHRQRT